MDEAQKRYILRQRLKKAQKLQKEHYTKRNNKLINELLNAIEHHTFLINEE